MVDVVRKKAKTGEPKQFFEEVVLTWGSDECLFWPYAKISTGYGQFAIEPGRGGKRVLAHREACRRIHGEPPNENYDCAHSCNNGHLGCVNPKHLRWTTRAENMADGRAAGTLGQGSGCTASKLTKEDVVEIRELLAKGVYQEVIAKKFGVSRSAICLINTGKHW
jgi:hypothetical protein